MNIVIRRVMADIRENSSRPDTTNRKLPNFMTDDDDNNPVEWIQT